MRFTTGKAYEEDPIIGTSDLPEQQAKRGSAGEEGLRRGGVYLANWFPSGEGNSVRMLLLFLEHYINNIVL